MTKVVIHNNWGGFNLSDEAMETLKALKGEVELSYHGTSMTMTVWKPYMNHIGVGKEMNDAS